MARQIRVEYPGAYYHVMARGDRRESIFEDDEDRAMFLQTLEEVCGRCGWRIHAWMLMSNHYHWVLETPEEGLVEGMKWFQNTYTRRYNLRHRMWGHLFGGRYKAVVVEDDRQGRGDYLRSLFDYVHLNPMRARLVKPGRGKGLLDYPWSSLAQGYGIPADRRAPWLETQVGFELSGRNDTALGRRKMIGDLERRALPENSLDREMQSGQTLNSTLKRGWYLGSQDFREKLMSLLAKNKTESTRRERKNLHGEEAAGKLMKDGLKHFGLREEDLEQLQGSDWRKVTIAQALSRRTNVRQKWVAEKLKMGSAANVSQQLRRCAITPGKKMPAETQKWLRSVNCQ